MQCKDILKLVLICVAMLYLAFTLSEISREEQGQIDFIGRRNNENYIEKLAGAYGWIDAYDSMCQNRL